jgi:hypothetical protein
MFLRDYLYVDLDKVSGLASQLYDGVPDRATNVTARQKKLEADLKLIRGGTGSSAEDAIERNLGDSLFKDLEADLESLGLLTDLSESLADIETWESIDDLVSPGQILRITSRGTIFQPAQMSEAILGLATAAHGIAQLDIEQPDEARPKTVPPKAKSDAQKKAERSARQHSSAEAKYPEDLLPPGETIPLMNVPRAQLSGMIRVTRGVFGEGGPICI